MEMIAHRVNTIQQLKNTPTKYGVELDLRDFDNRLILQHDPFKDGEDFEKYLEYYQHGTMILNMKSEGIEFHILELLREHKIQNYFFLDSSFPMIYLLSIKGENNIALRFSEFEKLDTILSMKDKVKWVWTDCFTVSPITKENSETLKSAGLKICLVSPELQNRKNDIEDYIEFVTNQDIKVDAVCTKFPELWD